MRPLAVAAMYMSFFGLIGFAVWHTGSGSCLWALLLTPGIARAFGDKEEEEKGA